MDHFLRLDVLLTQRLALSPESGWWQWMRVLAHIGDGPYVFGGLGFIYLLSWLGPGFYLRRAMLSTMLIVLTALGIVTLIKYTVRRQRPRPPGEFVTFRYDAYSFPSGHSARLAALAVSSMFFFPNLGWVLVAMAVSVAMARVAVGIHYVSDILVGLGVGAVVAWQLLTILPNIGN
jgi:undecaprenyl-diphosphatase